MRKEVHAVYRRPISKHGRKVASGQGQSLFQILFRTTALVCILGIAAYLLFTWNSTEPKKVQARVSFEPTSESAPAQIFNSSAPLTDSNVSVTPIQNSLTAVDTLPTVTKALSKATPGQRDTAEKLLAFAESGDMGQVRDLDRDDILSLAQFLESALGRDTIASALEDYLGMPRQLFFAHPEAGSAIADLLQAVMADSTSATPQSLVFSDQVEPDGSVTGTVHVIPAGTRKVYASFENTGALQNLDRVLAVWRNPYDDKMVFTEFEPVRSGSNYNYVWLELRDGWPSGFYQLDLFHPQRNTELLASRSFNVR